ncbi:hypothetical protein [Solimonas marina]|uniref:Uncharacterized protein n=1 Tax=Solimonas marina TaxID=2714601 RepID=A0A970BA44_9GAMM|nr:hypothetical protein [Solimonas marina]NKF23001.1 hypothetical protein [Solimonas marina]
MNVLRNPEFQRNAWLELTPQRLMAMPIILGLVALVGHKLDGWLGGLPMISLSLFVIITVMYGAKQAGESLNQELVQGTWDQQRLSGMSPWTMTLGKLIGGPVFAWYGGLICLLIYALTATPDRASLFAALTAIFTALTFHALTLLSVLLSWRKLSRSVVTPRSRGASILLLVIFAPQLIRLIVGARGAGMMSWYGWQFSDVEFALLCATLAALWSVLGLYRAMREELAFRDPPTAWIAFLLFVFAFAGGWFYGHPLPALPFTRFGPVTAHLAVCAIVALGASYLMLFSERKDWVRLRRLLSLWKDGERRRAWELTPKWLASSLLATAVGLLFAVSALATQKTMEGIALASTAAAFFVFLVRDGAIVLGLNFARDQRRADAAAAIYLLVLYVLLPFVLIALHLGLIAATFWAPLVHEQPAWLIVMLAQAAAALDFARRRWHQLPA